MKVYTYKGTMKVVEICGEQFLIFKRDQEECVEIPVGEIDSADFQDFINSVTDQGEDENP